MQHLDSVLHRWQDNIQGVYSLQHFVVEGIILGRLGSNSFSSHLRQKEEVNAFAPVCLSVCPLARLLNGRTPFQTFHHRWLSFSGCRLTDLELTNRNVRFGINTAVVPAPVENFSISTIVHS